MVWLVLSLPVITATTSKTKQGHFVFLNDQGQHIDSLYLQSGDSGTIKLHNADNAEITDVRLQGVSPNIYMNCPNTHVTQGKLENLNKTNTMDVRDGFMYQTQDGTIYVGTRNKGLYKLNADGSDLVPFAGTDVRAGFMYQTRDGTIYVGTYKDGLKKLNDKRDGLKAVEKNINAKKEIINVEYGFMYQTQDGTIYVGTYDKGLYKLNATRDGLKEVDGSDLRDGFMYQTRDGTIYVGTYKDGLKKLNDDGSHLVTVADTNVRTGFMYQARDKTIYVGTYDKGLYKLNDTRDGLEAVDKKNINVDNKTIDIEYGFMYQIQDGTIYVGTHHKGLYKLNADKDGLNEVDGTHVDGGFMYQTQDETIYVGTFDQGLKKLQYKVNRVLASDSDCTINYFIPKGSTVKKTSVLTATGNVSGKTVTATLTISVNKGHFAFSKDGQGITHLSLKPGDSGTFTIKNTGTADISDFWVNQLPSKVNILNNSGVSASANPCPLNKNDKKTLTAKKSCEVGYKVPFDADPEDLTLIPLGGGANNSSTAMLKTNIRKLGHAIFRQNNQQITHLDLKSGDTTTFELYNAGVDTITHLKLLGLPSGMTFDSKCSGLSVSLPAGVSCTITYNVPNDAKKNTFTLTVTGNPDSSDNSGSAVLTINIIPTNTGHFVFLNDQGQHIDSLYLQPGDSGRIKLHNAGNAEITDVRLQGVSQNIYMNCPNTHVNQSELKNFNTTNVRYGFMYQTRDGTIYVGTYKDGLKKLNAARDGLEPVEANKTDKTKVTYGFMYQTRDGTIYVGTN